jgi:hypothetical protein
MLTDAGMCVTRGAVGHNARAAAGRAGVYRRRDMGHAWSLSQTLDSQDFQVCSLASTMWPHALFLLQQYNQANAVMLSSVA